MQVNITTAKAKLSELIEAAEKGEEVIIARGNRPAVRMIPIHRPVAPSRSGIAGTVHDLVPPQQDKKDDAK